MTTLNFVNSSTAFPNAYFWITQGLFESPLLVSGKDKLVISVDTTNPDQKRVRVTGLSSGVIYNAMPVVIERHPWMFDAPTLLAQLGFIGLLEQ